MLAVLTGVTGALIFGSADFTGALAVVLLYSFLTTGPMSLSFPLTAVPSAEVPLLAGVIRGERLTVLGFGAIGIGIGIGALWVRRPGAAPRVIGGWSQEVPSAG
ncbi:MAG: hypothetical protein H7279_05180 [Microbacteriaceae bacterium]|nr:hypothetical protein [Microbacteriaceae bacterium]